MLVRGCNTWFSVSSRPQRLLAMRRHAARFIPSQRTGARRGRLRPRRQRRQAHRQAPNVASFAIAAQGAAAISEAYISGHSRRRCNRSQREKQWWPLMRRARAVSVSRPPSRPGAATAPPSRTRRAELWKHATVNPPLIGSRGVSGLARKAGSSSTAIFVSNWIR